MKMVHFNILLAFYSGQADFIRISLRCWRIV